LLALRSRRRSAKRRGVEKRPLPVHFVPLAWRRKGSAQKKKGVGSEVGNTVTRRKENAPEKGKKKGEGRRGAAIFLDL